SLIGYPPSQFLENLPIRVESAEGKQGGGKGDGRITVGEAVLTADKSYADQVPDKEDSVSHAYVADEQGHVGPVFQWHGNKKQ
ncbi:MAG TPA: hypothetical protein VGB56_07215, partial [Flavisolibacter sp.]